MRTNIRLLRTLQRSVFMDKQAILNRLAKTPDVFKEIYGDNVDVLEKQKDRWAKTVNDFTELYEDNDEIVLFSTPGRTEIGGNHTDHNHGKVLAASVDLDIIAVVAPTYDHVVTVKSEGFPVDVVDLSNLEPIETERFSSAALIRGVAARLKDLGYEIGGFNAYTTSNVLKGSGLSSSAAFEVLIVSIFNHLFNNGSIHPVENAQIAQYAENVFFGKPCGLMDQTACSVGSFVTIDFEDTDHPIAQNIDFDFQHSGYSLVITDTGGNHANLNDEYASIRLEMCAVAEVLGGQYLRQFTLQDVLTHASEIREKCGDRAILRAIHFFNDNGVGFIWFLCLRFWLMLLSFPGY